MSQQDATEHAGTYSDPIQSVVQKLADSISDSIRSQDFDAINSKTHLLYSLLEVQERYGARTSIAAEIERMHTDMDVMHTDMNKIEEKLASFLKRGAISGLG
jgi:hypothetical protein